MSFSFPTRAPRLWLAAALLGCAAPACGHTCTGGERWCEGDLLHSCEDTGNKVLNKQSLRTTDCAQQGEGVSCVESKRRTFCGFPDVSCSGKTGFVCVGTHVASCGTDNEHPSVSLDCADSHEICVEKPDAGVACSQPSGR